MGSHSPPLHSSSALLLLLLLLGRERMAPSQNPLFSMLASTRSFHAHHMVMPLYRKRHLEPSIKQNVANRILSAIDHETSQEGALQKLEALNVYLTLPIVNWVLTTSQLPLDVLWSFFSWSRAKGCKHNLNSYSTLVRKLKKGQRIEFMKQILEDMQKDGCTIPLPIFQDVISAFASSRNIEAVKEIWNEMKVLGCKPDAACFNIIMNLLMEEKQYQEGLNFYKDMLQCRCCPDANTYHILIKTLINADKLEAAHLIMKKIPQFGIQPYAMTFDEMVKASLKSGDLDVVTELLLEMKEAHREPKESTMLEVHKAFKRAGKSMDVLKQELPAYFDSDDLGTAEASAFEQGTVFEKMPERELEVSYTFRPSLVEKLQTWGPSAIKTLEDLHFKWNASSASDLLKGLHVDAAFGFFTWLKEQEGYAHDQNIYNRMVMILLTNRRYTDIGCLLDEMIPLGFRLEIWVLNQILESYGSNYDALGALSFYKKMAEVGMEPSPATFTCLIGILMRHQLYQQAMEIYATMLQSGIQPNCLTYSVLIHGLGIAGKAEAGHKLLNIMLKHGYRPNVITYTALMGAYARINNITKVMELYQEMQDVGIGPTPITYRVLSRALHRAGDEEAAKEMEEKLQLLIFSGVGELVLEKNREFVCQELLNSLEAIVGISHKADSS